MTLRLLEQLVARLKALLDVVPAGADIVTLTGAQTLTNKTLTSPAVNSPTIATPTMTGAVTGTPSFAAGTTVAPGAWQTFSYQNSWVDASSLGNPVAGYRKLADGNVQFRGAIKNGTATSGTPFATLPVGFRPTGKHVYLLITAGAVCIMDIQTTGVCTLFGAPSPVNNTEVVLDQVLVPTT